jgi:NADH:ubiquinone oxidoreductase subunit F (NADH-binding)
MTTAMIRPASTTPADPTAWSIGAPRLLAGLDHGLHRLDHRAHYAVHGPQPAVDLPRLLGMLDGVVLAGRGGAGFPLAAKIRALPAGTPREVVVNGCESEPASLKDRLLLRYTPHLVLDGALGLAASLGAHRVTLAVHDSVSADSVRAAIAERSDARIVRIHRLPGGFVSGEARAVMRSIRRGPAIPPGRRIHASSYGVILGNVETFAQLAVLLRLGPQRYGDTGSLAEPGSTLLSLGGAVSRSGVVEVPLGIPLGVLLEASHAAPAQAVVVGGYHGGWLPADPELRLSRAGITQAGGSFGAGVVLVLDHDTCGLGELLGVTDWLAAESAKQCGPCVFGLPALARDIRAIWSGDRKGLAQGLRHADLVDGRGACRHPDGAARFVRSGLNALSDEIAAHLRGGCGRPVRGQLPIGGSR